MSLARWLSASLLLVTLSAGIARADGPASAREHFNRGTALYDLGRYREAAAEYEAAYELKNDPALLFNIGQAYRLAGENANALRAYRSFLRRMPNAINRAEITARIDALQAAVDVTAPSNPASAPTVLAPPVASTPAHGADLSPDTAVAMPAGTTPIRKVDAHTARTERLAGIGLIAGGGALLVTGAVLVALAHKANDEVIDGNMTFVPSAETRRNALQASDAVCFAVGGAAAVAGIVLYVVGRRDSRPARLAQLFSSAGIRF